MQDSLLFEVPAPLPMDPPTEEENVNQFTVAQLSSLVCELKAVCPSGVFPTTKSFVDVFRAVTGRAVRSGTWKGMLQWRHGQGSSRTVIELSGLPCGGGREC